MAQPGVVGPGACSPPVQRQLRAVLPSTPSRPGRRNGAVISRDVEVKAHRLGLLLLATATLGMGGCNRLLPVVTLRDRGPADSGRRDGSRELGVSDAASCTASCAEGCGKGSCEVNCMPSYACPGVVVCAPGLPCIVRCGTENCGGTIDCSAASSCEIHCENANSCAGTVLCGRGPCTVTCGSGACAQGVDCSGSAERCSVSCSSAGACRGPVTCGSGPCVVTCAANTCPASISCRQSCSCAVQYHTGSCAIAPLCPEECATGCMEGMGCDRC